MYTKPHYWRHVTKSSSICGYHNHIVGIADGYSKTIAVAYSTADARQYIVLVNSIYRDKHHFNTESITIVYVYFTFVDRQSNVQKDTFQLINFVSLLFNNKPTLSITRENWHLIALVRNKCFHYGVGAICLPNCVTFCKEITG